MQNNYSELIGDLIVKPGPELLDPTTDGLKQDLTLAVTSATTPVRRTWSEGMLLGSSPFRSRWRATLNAGLSTATTRVRSPSRCSPTRCNCRNAPTSHSLIG
jgi:Domain of unknown function (DUF4436)